MCWPTAQLAAAERSYALLHQKRPFHDGTFQTWAEEASEATPFHYLDGVTIYLAEHDENPDDAFTTDELARPPSVAQDALDEYAEPGHGGDNSN